MADKEYKVTLNDIQQKAMNGQMVDIQLGLKPQFIIKLEKLLTFIVILKVFLRRLLILQKIQQ